MTRHALRRPWLRPVVVFSSGLLALVAVLGSSAPAVRVPAVLAFLLVGPGLALVGLLEVDDAWREIALVLGVSLALDVVVVGGLAYAGQRSAGVALAALLTIAAAGALAQVLQDRRRRRVSGGASS